MVRKKKGKTGGSAGDGPGTTIIDSDLVEELESRFLSYALSTIVSRALPDVRDGLKPVHRRVLYAMNQLKLNPDARFRKSAAVVGDVIGKYHPHGDQSIYDTMVRLAQDFSLRYPLVEGQGNFGNIDGDSAAAMRYTEAKLTKLAMELCKELPQNTVTFTPTYDQLNEEPSLLPARFPNLLVNGSSGIAVGMATNIPPHNLTETIDALVALIAQPKLETRELLKYVKGPDFPTGGELVATKSELAQVYETGRGTLKVKGEWEVENLSRGRWQIIITSVPYTVNKSRLIEKFGDLIRDKKIGDLVDVRDESTEIIRIVLEPKSQNVDAGKAMAYLFQHSDLQITFAANLVALTPDATPERHSLQQMLKSFLSFRFETTEKRLRYDLKIIDERLHLLKAFAKVYKDLDAAIQIIRKSKTRDEARSALMEKFKLDEVQANAILDLRLAALVGLEMSKVKKEKAEKDAEKEEIEKVLESDKCVWRLVKKELEDIKAEYGDKRRTKIVASVKDTPVYDAESYVEHEETHIIVSRNGWVRRVKNVTNPATLRFKEQDSLLSWLPMNTKDLVCFFTSTGKVYVSRAIDFTQTTGFGDPVQSLFRFGDGERLVSVIGVITDNGEEGSGKEKSASQRGMFDQLDDRAVAGVLGHVLDSEKAGELLVVTEMGSGFRFVADFVGPTTKNGKRVANVKGDDAILSVTPVTEKMLFLLSNEGKGLLIDMKEIAQLSGPGAGVRLMKLKPGGVILGAKEVSKSGRVGISYLSGKDDVLKVASLPKGSRGQTGRKVAAARKKLLGLFKTV